MPFLIGTTQKKMDHSKSFLLYFLSLLSVGRLFLRAKKSTAADRWCQPTVPQQLRLTINLLIVT